MVKLIWFFMLLFSKVVRSTTKSSYDASLTARDLLYTIAPNYRQAKLPPGFPSLDAIKTDKFDYGTKGSTVRVTASLDKPVSMFPSFITISNVKTNFTFDKNRGNNGSWEAKVKGSLAVGASVLHVNISSDGKLTAFDESLDLHDICLQFLKENFDTKKNLGIDVNVFSLENVTFTGKILQNMNGMELLFEGYLTLTPSVVVKVKIHVNKYRGSRLQFFMVAEFNKSKPASILKKILNQKTQNIPFLAHMLSDSDLFTSKIKTFAFTFSFNEVYYYRDNSIAGQIIETVLQSHIPEGVTILFPIQLSKKSIIDLEDTVKVAFVINEPEFDLLINQNDKMSVKEILSVLSSEFASIPSKNIPKFVTELADAYTTHVSFDSGSSTFSIFVRLNEFVELIPDVLKIKITNLVLQRKVGTDNKKAKWRVSAKGIYKIGKKKVNVQYSGLTEQSRKPYGLTGYAKSLGMQDIIDEFDPYFYPDEMAKKMIENTEIENLTIHNLRLFSRVPRKNGTPHILITGFANLPQWEKDVQVALLLLYTSSKWSIKWAASFKHSPLSNIIEALTGFDSRDIKLLHNNHIMTTIISSPLPSYSLLPQHIITTPLLRLPVKRAITIIALLRFPDNCGDDKMCSSASKLLNPSKTYTAKGVLSLNGFKLISHRPSTLNISKHLKLVNATVQFTIGNKSSLNIVGALKIPKTNLTFDGFININKSGEMELLMKNRDEFWSSPFNFEALSFKDLQLDECLSLNNDMNVLKLKGKLLLGSSSFNYLESNLNLNFNPLDPLQSTFYANFSYITLPRLLNSFDINAALPKILTESTFPFGLMLSYSGRGLSNSIYEIHGEIQILGRLLSCNIEVIEEGHVIITTENSPAPFIFAKGQIIIQQDANTKLRGPRLIADINRDRANIIAKGYVKVLGLEANVDIELHNKDIRFSVSGKLMDFKQTRLTAYTTGSTDSFQVFGCLDDVSFQVQLLLIEIITRSANQSMVNMEKAEENFMHSQKLYEIAEREEFNIRVQRDKKREHYESQLIEFGRYEVRVNDTCISPKCGLKCFGCPRLNKCCRLDIFGHCIACSAWKSCCWKNIDPLCIAKYDGCHVIRTLAEKDLAEKEAQIMHERILLDNLEQQTENAQIEKGKHKAVLEAAIDAKQVVAEDSSPGLNAHDAIKNFGFPSGWAKINSVCYDTTMEQAATGCMYFHVASEFFRSAERNITIWSCLKEDLVTELTESLANYIFPNIIDTSVDGVNQVETTPDITKTGNNQLNIQLQQSNEKDDNFDYEGQEVVNQVPNIVNPGTGVVNQGTEVANQGTELANQGTNMVNQGLNNAEQGTNILTQGIVTINQGTDKVNQGTSVVTQETELGNQGSDLPAIINEIGGGPLLNTEPLPTNQTMDESESVVSFPIPLNVSLGEPEESLNNEQSITIIPPNPIPQTNIDGLPLLPQNDSRISVPVTLNDEAVSNTDDENSNSTFDLLPNQISTNGTSQVELIDASSMPNISISTLPNSFPGSASSQEGSASDEFSSGSGEEPGSGFSAADKELKTLFETEIQKDNVKIKQKAKVKAKSKASKKVTSLADHIVEEEIDEDGKPNVASSTIDKTKDEGNISSSNFTRYFLSPKFIVFNGIKGYPTISKNNNPFPDLYHNRKSPLSFHSEYEDDPYYFSREQEDKQQKKKKKNKKHKKKKKESKQNFYGFRYKRDISNAIDESAMNDLGKSKRLLFSSPFWDLNLDRVSSVNTRSTIPTHPSQQKIMNGMMKKRWKIPENSIGRCHIFRQLIAICKDMAETIVLLDKSLKTAMSKFHDEDKSTYLELFDTEEFLVEAAKKVNVSTVVMGQADRTLVVVKQGVNIWSKRCSNEFDWQNQSGVQTWLQAMDLKIQQLGGFGVYRFLENLFHAFEALFEVLRYSDSTAAKNALGMLQRIRQISKDFDKVFKNKLSVSNSRTYADHILTELSFLRKDSIFC